MASNRWPCSSVTAVRCSARRPGTASAVMPGSGCRRTPTNPRRRCFPGGAGGGTTLRHTFALQLLSYLEQQMDGDEPDAVARRRRHLAYLGGHIKHNPLLIVSRRLGHSSPATTYAYLEYTDDPMNAVDAAFRAWTAQEGDTYADIASRMLADSCEP